MFNATQTFIETSSSNIVNDPHKIANNFNDYFINVGPNLANKIKHNDNNNFKKYLKGSYQSSFFLNPITENELKSKLKNMTKVVDTMVLAQTLQN